jgi:signal transduction histidine kinase
MLRTLRSRLIISHILPLVVVVPLMYFALAYMLETRFLVPRLTDELLENARYLSEITRARYLSQITPDELQLLLNQMQLNPAMRVMYLGLDGTLRYSNDPAFFLQRSQRLTVPGLDQALAGDEVVLVNYSMWGLREDFIQVVYPVPGPEPQSVAGILWMSYYSSSVNQLFQQMRLFSVIIIVGCLLIGSLLGTLLALNISRPVQKVTQAIHSLARGERSAPIAEQGPEEIRDLVRAVNFLVERLQNLEQARRQLLANLVHELGRPLGALRSAIQALAKGAAKDAVLLDELTSGMDEETSRLQHILEDLLHLHDQVLGALEIQVEEVKMSEWLPRMLSPWQEAAVEKRLTWRVEIPPYLPPVAVDRVRFAQVIGNLLSNAIKYTPPGKSVCVMAGEGDEEIWIKVVDTGLGIPLDEQEKIFRPFYRGDQGRRIKQGMGLGLSIARDLSAAHGGRLEVESSPGAGSTFTVWLPVRHEQAPELSS